MAMIDPTLSDASLPRFIPLQDVHPAEHLMILAKGDAGIDWVPEETRKHFRTPHTLWPWRSGPSICDGKLGRALPLLLPSQAFQR